MNGSADLERRYRHLLAWYPRSFRAENEEEILAVLLDCAQDGQTRPGAAATADLLKGALWMRLRPPGYPPRTLIAAVRLMLLGAVVEVGALAYVLAGSGSIKAGFRHVYPAATAAQWHALSVQLTTDQIAAPVVFAAWLVLAWSIGRGHEYSRALYVFFYLILLAGLLEIVTDAAATQISPAGVAIDATSCTIGLATLVLISTPPVNRWFRRLSPQPVATTH
jgi:hypothetical protein